MKIGDIKVRPQTVNGLILLLIGIVIGLTAGTLPGYKYRVIAAAGWILAVATAIGLIVSLLINLSRDMAKKGESENEKA